MIDKESRGKFSRWVSYGIAGVCTLSIWRALHIMVSVDIGVQVDRSSFAKYRNIAIPSTYRFHRWHEQRPGIPVTCTWLQVVNNRLVHYCKYNSYQVASIMRTKARLGGSLDGAKRSYTVIHTICRLRLRRYPLTHASLQRRCRLQHKFWSNALLLSEAKEDK